MLKRLDFSLRLLSRKTVRSEGDGGIVGFVGFVWGKREAWSVADTLLSQPSA